jgi:hypothetical protein
LTDTEKSPRIELWVLLTCVGIAVFVFVAGKRSTPTELRPAMLSPFGAFPQGASIVIAANLEKLRQSPLSGLVDEGSREIVGESVRETCGFDPIDRAHSLVLVIPNRTQNTREETSAPPFGISASGNFERANVGSCAIRVIEKRGGDPARADLGSFLAIRDRKSAGEVAVRDGGPLLLSEGWYMREMIDAADGKIPSLASDDQHATLREAVGGKGSSLLVTFISPPGWLERMAGSEIARLSPLSSVRAGALRIDVQPRFEAKLLLGCASAAQCDEVAAFVERMRTDVRQGLAQELGEDPILEFKTEREKNAVRAFIELDPKKTAKLAARLLIREPPPQPAYELPPDEVLRPAPPPSAAPSR